MYKGRVETVDASLQDKQNDSSFIVSLRNIGPVTEEEVRRGN